MDEIINHAMNGHYGIFLLDGAGSDDPKEKGGGDRAAGEEYDVELTHGGPLLRQDQQKNPGEGQGDEWPQNPCYSANNGGGEPP